MSSFPYSRRDGAEDLGHEYEHLMTALFSLRFALSKNFEEFWIASNVDHVSDFDDIVMSLKSKTGNRIAFLIQLKHVQSKAKALNVKSFTYSKKNRKGQRKKHKEGFSIEKYWEGFDQFQKQYLEGAKIDDSPIIKELREAHKIIFVLYTNKGVDKGNYLKKPEVSNDFLDLLDTNDMEHCHEFNQEHQQLKDYDADFLSKLRIFANQLHADEILNLIKAEIRTFLKLNYPSMVDFNDVLNQYVQYVKTWIKGYQIGKEKMYYTLTKPEVLKILSGILLDTYKYDFSTKHFTCYEDAPKIIWNQIISGKSITLVNKNDRVIQFIQSYYGSEVRKFIQKPPTVWSELLAEKAVTDFCRKFGHAEVAQVCQNPELSMGLIYKTLWMYGTVPLLLDPNENQHFKDILKILEVCQNSIKVIVLVTDISKVKFAKNNLYFVTLHDLPPEQQEIMMEVEVNFQDRLRLPLMDLVDKSMYSIIKCHDVIDILCSEFIVGARVGEIYQYFIGRCLSRVLLRYEVIKIANEAFLIEAHDSQVAREKLKEFIPKSSKIYFVTSDEVMKRLKSTKGTRHRLKYNEGYFEWVESVGEISNLRNYQLVSHQDEYELLQPQNLGEYLRSNRKKQTRVISGCPGMGKSTLIDFVARSAPKDVWVVKIKLTDVAVSKVTIKEDDPLSKTNSKLDNSESSDYSLSDSDSCSDDDDLLAKSFDILKYFDNIVTEDGTIPTSEITLAVFKRFYKSNQILILLDGFDEISILYKKKVTDIISMLQANQHPVWVTTRDHMRTHLEDALSVLASTIKPFTEPEQKSFLTTYFKANIETSNETIVQQFTERLLEAARKNLNDRDSQFTGVPLQTKLLAEVFLKNCESSCRLNEVKFNARFDLLKLYGKFVKQKNKILIDEKFGVSEKILLKSIDIEEAQQYFALYNVFGSFGLRKFNIEETLARFYKDIKSQIVQRGGILVVSEGKKGLQIEFIHRTFAEYFVAKFLSENFLTLEDSFRRNILSLIDKRFTDGDEHEFLFSIFDIILAQRQPLHLNIINLKIDQLAVQIEQDPRALLVQDGFKRSGLHMLALYGKEIPKSDFEGFTSKVESFKISDLKLTDCLGYNVLDYCVYVGSWAFAATICRAAFDLPLSVYSDVRFVRDDRDVFRTVFHNFLIRDLLIGEIYEDTPIYDYCRRITKDLQIAYDSWKFRAELDVATVSEYLKQVGIKGPEDSTYFDIRFAVALGSKSNVEDLLASSQIDVNERDANNGNTLLHYASYNSRGEIFELLLDHGADVNAPGRNGGTVWHTLARTGQISLLEKCLDKSEYVDIENDDGQTAVDYALWFNQMKAVSILVWNGAKISKKNAQFIHHVAEAGDNELMLKLLRQKFDINYQLYNQKTALHSALEHGHISTAKLLINRKIDLSLDTTSESFLHLTAKIGNRDLFEDFLSKGSNINKLNSLWETPLLMAIKHGHAELAEYIISQGADVGIRCKYGNALTESFNLGNENLISQILDRSSDIDERIIQGKTPLLLALEKMKPDIAKLLLNRVPAPDVTLADNFGVTPLHLAASRGYLDLVINFLQKPVDVDARTVSYETPLLLALEHRNLEIAEVLCNNNANVLLEDKGGKTPLHYVSSLGHYDLAKKFLQRGADVNKENNNKFTPFLLALENGHNEIADLFLNHGTDLTKTTLYGNTSLHLASRTGNIKLVNHCLKLIDVNKKNNFGTTPLHDAVSNNQIPTARLLMDNGADIFLQDDFHDTTLHIAAKTGDEDFVRQLLDKNLDVNALNDLNKTPLCVALIKHQWFIAKLLISRGARIDTTSKDGLSVLHLAAISGFDELVEECLEKNIFDINKEDNEGTSPLDWALGYGRVGCINLLLRAGASVQPRYVSYLFNAFKSKIKSESELAEVLTIAQELVSRCSNINVRQENKNTVLHEIILTARKSRSEGMDQYGEKLFEEVLKLLATSGGDANFKNGQGKSVLDLITEDKLDHLINIFS